jgi:hypothetical protein
MSDDWKPQDELTAADFDRAPLWGYDPAKAEGDPDSDESWVRPWRFAEPPDFSDLLFVKAKLRTAGNDVLPGAVLFLFEEGVPKVAGLALLEPSVFIIGLENGQVTPDDRADLKDLHPGALPMAYEAELTLGGRALRLAGGVK